MQPPYPSDYVAADEPAESVRTFPPLSGGTDTQRRWLRARSISRFSMRSLIFWRLS